MTSPTDSLTQGRGTVVLLHGFAGLAIMNRPLARLLGKSGFRTVELGYDSWGRSLGAICDRLAPRLAAITQGPAEPLHIVAHSMGGLVARALISRARPTHLGHVVMLGTPNAGSEVADFVAQWPVLRPILGKAAAALVTRRPAEIEALLGPIDYSLGIIAGNSAAPGLGLSRLIAGPNDGKVSVESTRLTEAADHIVLPLQHALLLYHPLAQRQVRAFLLDGRFDHHSGESAMANRQAIG